jgi:RNA polymerase sigma-54 factor
MKPGLSLRVSQHLALTPQLQQSIRLLQLSTLELSQEVGQMLDENPFLELQDDTAEREQFGLQQADAVVSTGDRVDEQVSQTESTSLVEEESVNWDGDGSAELVPDDSEWGGDATSHSSSVHQGEEQDATVLARSSESLPSFLHRQALGWYLEPVDAQALHFLIESLNEDGYLEDSLDVLVAGLLAGAAEKPTEEDVTQLHHHFTVALRLLQSLEPAGVGARNLAECLQLQLLSLQSMVSPLQRNGVAVALRICALPIDLLARRDIKRLVQLGAGSDAQVREAIALIGRLDPKPGRVFADVERNIVVPDVIVTSLAPLAGSSRAGEPRLRVQLNPEVMPKLRIHDMYADALRGHRGGTEGSYAALQQRLQEARWFIKNIQQRFDTILRVSTAIVERQKNFFMHGELAMRPLVLREIADELGMHESTISRVTTAKYMATPLGTFELKYFFGSGLGTDSGSSASSTAVRALIKQFIGAENHAKPLSDNQLSEMLKEQGIDCARRTVAKYREGLKIAPASLRKAL